MLRANHPLHQCLETRIATERIEQRINFNKVNIHVLVVRHSLLQPSNRFFPISKTEIEQRALECAHVAVPGEFFQFSQHLHRCLLVP